MTKKKITNEYIANIIGVTKGAVTHWSNGKRFPKEERYITEISDILGVTIVDLFQNSKENKKKIVIEELNNNFDAYLDYIPTVTLPSSIKKIPIDHGYPSTNKIVMENQMQNAEYIYVDKLMLGSQYQESQELKAVVILGDSMKPCLAHGDIAIYTPTKEYIGKGKYVIQTRTGLEVALVSELKKEKALIVSSQDPSYPTETFKEDELDVLEFIGFVIGSLTRS